MGILKAGLAAGLLAVGVSAPAWATPVVPTTASYMSISLLMTPVSGQQYYATVAGTVGMLPGLYGDGDSKCYVSGTIVEYPPVNPQDSLDVALTFTSKNATTGQCPDYTKFGTLHLRLNWPQWNSLPPGFEDWQLQNLTDFGGPSGTPSGILDYATAYSVNGANEYIESADPWEPSQPLPSDYQGFVLIPSSGFSMVGGMQVYLAPGLANTIGF